MIYIYGSIARDFIFAYPGEIELDLITQKINYSFLASSFMETRGGTATNIAYNLRLMGVECGILGVIGNDSAYLNWLNSVGINTGSVFMSTLPTSSSVLLSDNSGKQIIIFYPGAMNEIVNNCLSNFDWSKPSFVVVSAGYPEGINYTISKCIQHSLDFLYNPGQSIYALSKIEIESAISFAKIVLVNEAEYAYMNKIIQDVDGKVLRNGNLLVVTYGVNGSIIKSIQGNNKFNAISVLAKEPTGAGDAYCAGVIDGFVKNYPISIIGKTASLISAYAVEELGSTDHQFSLEEFSYRFQEVYKDK